jgi:TRAP transporter 4TM/12TM fusion protein
MTSATSLRQLVFRYINEGRSVELDGPARILVAIISILMAAYIFRYAFFSISSLHLHTAIFLTGMLPIVFLTTSAHTGRSDRNWIDWLWTVGAIVACSYFIFNWRFYDTMIEGITRVSRLEVAMSVVMTVFVIEACRRVVGWGLTGTCVLLLLYVAYGHHLGGALGHTPISLEYYARRITVSEDALFGVTVEVAATYGFLFVFFGSIYHRAGGGQFFFDLASALVGRTKGGATKACVVSSGIYGSVSGSPTADVMTTGPITIPIMRRSGATATRAAATEAAASCGGAILPPVMGSVAFLMVEYTGIPYRSIALAATGIAILYYLGVLAITHHESSYLREGALQEGDVSSLPKVLKRDFRLIFPVFALLYLIEAGYSPTIVAAGSSVIGILSSYLTPDRNLWVTPSALLECCIETAVRISGLTAACAAAGMAIGYLDMSGLVGKFSFILSAVSGGNFAVVIVAAAVLLIILGLGLPTAAVYIMGVALVAPVLIADYGLSVMTAHMFMLVFACMSAITPPMAVAAMAAAALAGANADRVGYYGCRLAYAGFLLPFLFVVRPELLLEGAMGDVVVTLVAAFISVLAISYAIAGTVRQSRIRWPFRILIAVGGLIILVPGTPALVASIVVPTAMMVALIKWASKANAREIREGGAAS